MIIYENYHKHTFGSNPFTPDSPVSLEDYCKRAKEIGQKTLSTVEHGWQGQYYDAFKLCKKYDLKLVIGAEAYWVKDRFESDRSNNHIIILAKNENGRQALNDVLSEANLTGFYYKPRLDLELIKSLPKDDVIVTTSCIAFWKYEDSDKIVESLKDHFGKNFYLEVQPHNCEKQAELNRHILTLHNELKIPLIAGIDSHFIYLKDKVVRDDLIKSKGIEYEDENDWYMDVPDGDELYHRFAEQTVLSHSEIMEAIDNTQVVMGFEDYDSPIFNDDIKMPSIPSLEGCSQEEKDKVFLDIVRDAWEKEKPRISPNIWPKYEEAIKYETQIVVDTHTADYFIDNYYIVKRAVEKGGMLTWTGRGSAVSFYINKLLGFTKVDRIAATIHMYPDRFMSTTRILKSKSLPDIDLNEGNVQVFAEAQTEVLGEGHSYPMIAYGTLKTNAAWKIYSKAQDIPFEVSNAISERIKLYEKAIKHAKEDIGEDENPEDYVDINKYVGAEYKAIFDGSKNYRGIIDSWSIHPCSYLIYAGDIRKEVGLVRIKDHICCLMDGHWAEDCHFLKQDHLKVSVVELIYSMYGKIKNTPKNLNILEMCPPDDCVWDIYAKGCCIGINQLEKEGTSSRVAKYKPKNISELAAFVAAIRPGFATLYKKFESREPFSFGIPSLDNIIQTEETPNSYIMYQEQIMAVLNYAGIDMGECYTAIKNIAKKRAEKVLVLKDQVINGLLKKLDEEGIDPEKSKEVVHLIWQTIEDASSYSFNDSHAYCVALDSLYSAWVKAHYPMIFYETFIQILEEKGEKDRILQAKTEAESYFNIRFAPLRFGQDNRITHIDPDHDKTFVNSLGVIKGFGKQVSQKLYAAGQQKYKSFMELLFKLDSMRITATTIEPLIKIDYFHDFGDQVTLLRILEVFEFFKHGDSKSIKKDKMTNPEIIARVEKFANSKRKDGSDAASYTFPDSNSVIACMYEIEDYLTHLKAKELSLKVKLANELGVLGYVTLTTGNESDRKKLLIKDLCPLKAKGSDQIWAYRVSTYSIGSGKNARITIYARVFEKNPINVGDIIYADSASPNAQGYWYIHQYHHVYE